MEIDIFLRKNDEGCLFYVFNFNVGQFGCLFHVPINDGRLCSPLFTKNINIKSNCNCILIKNKVHFAIDIFFFQSALTFLEFNALRIFLKSALLFPSTLTQRFMTRINQEIKKKVFLLISILLNKTSFLTGKILQFLNKSLKQTTT